MTDPGVSAPPRPLSRGRPAASRGSPPDPRAPSESRPELDAPPFENRHAGVKRRLPALLLVLALLAACEPGVAAPGGASDSAAPSEEAGDPALGGLAGAAITPSPPPLFPSTPPTPEPVSDASGAAPEASPEASGESPATGEDGASPSPSAPGDPTNWPVAMRERILARIGSGWTPVAAAYRSPGDELRTSLEGRIHPGPYVLGLICAGVGRLRMDLYSTPDTALQDERTKIDAFEVECPIFSPITSERNYLGNSPTDVTVVVANDVDPAIGFSFLIADRSR